MGSLREDILGADDGRCVPVPTPEWPVADGKLAIMALTETEKSEWESAIVSRKRSGDYQVNTQVVRAELVWRCTVDRETKARVFSAADEAALRSKSAAVIGRLYDVAARLCGVSDRDVDDLVGNSVTARGAASGTA